MCYEWTCVPHKADGEHSSTLYVIIAVLCSLLVAAIAIISWFFGRYYLRRRSSRRQRRQQDSQFPDHNYDTLRPAADLFTIGTPSSSPIDFPASDEGQSGTRPNSNTSSSSQDATNGFQNVDLLPPIVHQPPPASISFKPSYIGPIVSPHMRKIDMPLHAFKFGQSKDDKRRRDRIHNMKDFKRVLYRTSQQEEEQSIWI